MFSVTRYHDISAGHRVWGHESKCANLHGHNYRIHFTVAPVSHLTDDPDNMLDFAGRVIDFGVIKSILCEWLEREWDHKTLIFQEDPWLKVLVALDPAGIVVVPFNPTAENMAAYLVREIGPAFLPRYVQLVSVTIDETRKCSATYGPVR